jgi:hypothetical protein
MSDNAMAAGDLLIEAKAQLKHGTWLPWLRDHCAMSPRSAQLYMRRAKNRAAIEKANAQSVAHLTVNEAVALLSDGLDRVLKNQRRLEQRASYSLETPQALLPAPWNAARWWRQHSGVACGVFDGGAVKRAPWPSREAIEARLAWIGQVTSDARMERHAIVIAGAIAVALDASRWPIEPTMSKR